MPFGVSDINRQIHEKFRFGFLKLTSEPMFRNIPKPLGAERIVYGDKVINLGNHRRYGKRVYPSEGALGYLANGEIGIAVGWWQTGKNPKTLKVEFSSQQGFTYSFYASDFREEGDPALELAYALTVHRAQGSQFRLVILVLPEGHPILSPELIYTALTRHQDRVVVMHRSHASRTEDHPEGFCRSPAIRNGTPQNQPSICLRDARVSTDERKRVSPKRADSPYIQRIGCAFKVGADYCGSSGERWNCF